tara:strand:+ start:606 stop:2186 length:1581 start_codon:yes stop_codon:yes gene_type:complete
MVGHLKLAEKPVGDVIEALVKEYGEGFRDPVWRICNLYKIVDKQGREIAFTPTPEQLYLIQNMTERNLILKARQLGMTTVCCLIYLDDCLFHDNTRATIIAHKVSDAIEIFLSKVKAVYEALPALVRDLCPTKRSSQTTLELMNGSIIRTTTSARSGTVQWLHISEYGKMCAVYPDKAKEVRTGSFPAAQNGVITIESTAEGQEGDYYAKCQTAQEFTSTGKTPSRLDYQFFFFSWLGVPEYQIKQSIVPESPQDTKYFEKIERDTGHPVIQPQRNWWLATERDLGGDMKREYPATPHEAFEQAIEGAYFADQIAAAYKSGRIGAFPFNPGFAVNTCFDIGRNDMTTIWLWQDIGALAVFIGYYENSGEWVAHYINWLNQWREDKGAVWGKHYLPHDGDRKSFWAPQGSLDTMSSLGFHPIIVQRNANKIEQINVARRKFSLAAFDERETKVGLGRMKLYRKEWDERNGIFRSHPAHNEASHAADGWMTFSDSPHTPMPAIVAAAQDRYRTAMRNGRNDGRSAMSA